MEEARGCRFGRSGERTIGFGGHLDTVFPEGTDVSVRQVGDTLFAPGVGDDTRGLVLRVVSMGLGSVRYRVTVQGPGGHSWGAFGTANPAHALGRAMSHFQNVADTLTRQGPKTSYNVGRIGGALR